MLREAASTDRAPAAIGPYSQSIRAEGRLLFCSGQTPLTPEGKYEGGTIAEQTRQCLENVRAVLEASGATLDNVVKTTVFLTDMAHFGEMNEVYAAHFGAVPPARSTVAVAGLPRGVDVEIEAIAVL